MPCTRPRARRLHECVSRTGTEAPPRRPIALRSADDSRLLELARDGDERAFEVVVERYRVQLLAHARRVVGDHAAEDALQHALACAWDSLRRGCEVRHARAWLFAIVHNAALHMLGDRPETASETVQET